MTLYIIGQVLTTLSFLIFWYSRFFRKKKSILFGDNICRAVAILGFLALKTYDGIKMALFALLRNFVAAKVIRKGKKNKTKVFLAMLALLILLNVIGFNGISTICCGMCALLNLYGAIMLKEQGIRICTMCGAAFYFTFMFTTGNYAGAVCEVIGFMMNLGSYIKYRKKKRLNLN